MRLPFTEPPRSRARSLLLPGIALVSVLGLTAAAVKLATSRRSANAPSARPTGTAGATPDKPAGTELHPPNENFSRQGPGQPGGRGSKGSAKPNVSNAQAPTGAGPGQPGITAPKR